MTDEAHPEDDAADTLLDPIEEELEIDKPGVSNPEDKRLARDHTEYTNHDG